MCVWGWFALISSSKDRWQVTVPKRLAREIDSFCEYVGMSRSSFLCMAGALYLQVDPTNEYDAKESLLADVDGWKAEEGF